MSDACEGRLVMWMLPTSSYLKVAKLWVTSMKVDWLPSLAISIKAVRWYRKLKLLEGIEDQSRWMASRRGKQ